MLKSLYNYCFSNHTNKLREIADQTIQNRNKEVQSIIKNVLVDKFAEECMERAVDGCYSMHLWYRWNWPKYRSNGVLWEELIDNIEHLKVVMKEKHNIKTKIANKSYYGTDEPYNVEIKFYW